MKSLASREREILIHALRRAIDLELTAGNDIAAAELGRVLNATIAQRYASTAA